MFTYKVTIQPSPTGATTNKVVEPSVESERDKWVKTALQSLTLYIAALKRPNNSTTKCTWREGVTPPSLTIGGVQRPKKYLMCTHISRQSPQKIMLDVFITYSSKVKVLIQPDQAKQVHVGFSRIEKNEVKCLESEKRRQVAIGRLDLVMKVSPLIFIGSPLLSLTRPLISLTRPLLSLTSPLISLTRPLISLTRPLLSLTSPLLYFHWPAFNFIDSPFTFNRPAGATRSTLTRRVRNSIVATLTLVTEST
jgi:hypothetical protein